MAVTFVDWTLIIFVAIIFGFIGVYFYCTRNYKYWTNLGVRQSTPKFFFGNLASCVLGKRRPDEYFHELYHHGKGEKMIGFYIFDKPYLMLRNPELIKNVFVKDFNNFPHRVLSTIDEDLLGKNSLFLTRNPPWSHIRKELSPFFTSVRIKQKFELMLEICQDLKGHLQTFGVDDRVGKPLHIKEMCAKFVTDVIGKTAFGMDFESLKNPDAEFRKHGKAIFRRNFKRYLQLLSMFLVPSIQSYTRPEFFDKKGTVFLQSKFGNVIDERIRMKMKTSDLIDILIEMKKNQEIDPPTFHRLEDISFISQAAGIFAGGFVTSSSALSFALYELTMRPEIQKKLRDEVVMGLQKTGGVVTYELVTSLPYLHMICQETVRLYPIVPWLGRVSESDYTFSGTDVSIKKGTPVILPTRALHMDPNYFSNPEIFDPERFSEGNREKIIPFTYFPFGGGPRGCIGSKLALIQIKLGLITIISQYELTPCATTPQKLMLEDMNVFLLAPDELQMNFRKLSG
ncbi:hypothetical protein QAD02_001665 [Eretmocerus hayati]|uniref:Uncharacterized protein n=1 Tax=Eretmocerus hayati TaxID=131215 RepID=A0ACC2NIF7_9HYME|nr:hypothetical protein QAD02_001665 [Eretmocerus hayati]